ncbi:hypothetical protein [Rhodovulum adriaticum]|uniref:Uncharacterized protein n=1 Tax=Rhodovulum adriaticum TaxID=35804 RepID=A0A4R2NN51_RHOAD|nr:hypothetical protein [Rhodovulum adriaticum]MBK1634561.1 hypothetical protein [Rhodovulum adriaticum]TCP23070.1 hypothetical protein EV656_10439 [Rhodovulum adriaticum]
MGVLEDLADDLAQDTLAAVEETGDEKLIKAVADAIGASSPTTQEAFLTAVRIRTAAARGRKTLEDRLARARQGNAPAQG